MSDDTPAPRRKGLFAAVAALFPDENDTSPCIVTTPPPLVISPIVPPELLTGPSLIIQAETFARHLAAVSGWDYAVIWGGLGAVAIRDHWKLFTPWGWEDLSNQICIVERNYTTPIH